MIAVIAKLAVPLMYQVVVQIVILASQLMDVIVDVMLATHVVHMLHALLHV